MKSISFRDENGKIYYGWWIVLASAIITGLVYNGIVSVTGVFMLPVTEALGLSVAAYSLYITIMSLTGVITLAFISKYYNEKNIKKIMVIAGILGIISFIGFATANSLWAFYIFAVPQGFCFTAMTMTPCQLMVSNWFGDKIKGRAISFFLMGLTLGYIVELQVVGRIVNNLGWRAGYIVLAICIAICMLIALKVFVWSPEKKGIKRMGDYDDAELSQMQNKIVQGNDFKTAISKPLTWLLLISCSLAVILSSSILQHGIPTMVISGFSAEQAASIMSVTSTIMLVTGPLIGWVCDRFSLCLAATGTALCFAGAAVGLSLMGVSKSLVIVFCICYILGLPTVNAISPLLMNHLHGEKALPRLIGYVNVFIGVGGAFGAAIMGSLFEAYGSYQIPWLILASCLVVTAIIRAVGTTKKRKFVPESGEEV